MHHSHYLLRVYSNFYFHNYLHALIHCVNIPNRKRPIYLQKMCKSDNDNNNNNNNNNNNSNNKLIDLLINR